MGKEWVGWGRGRGRGFSAAGAILEEKINSLV